MRFDRSDVDAEATIGPDGAAIEDLELVTTAVVSTSKEGFAKGIVESPGYFALRT